MRRSLSATLIVVLISMPLAGPSAQALPKPPSAGRLPFLKRGEDLRVKCVGIQYVGQFEDTTADSLFIAGSRLSLVSVDTVWALRPAPVVARAAIGALGGTAGALLFDFLESFACALGCNAEQEGVSGTRIVIVAAIGLVGGILIPTGQYWSRVYP